MEKSTVVLLPLCLWLCTFFHRGFPLCYSLFLNICETIQFGSFPRIPCSCSEGDTKTSSCKCFFVQGLPGSGKWRAVGWGLVFHPVHNLWRDQGLARDIALTWGIACHRHPPRVISNWRGYKSMATHVSVSSSVHLMTCPRIKPLQIISY